MDRMDKEPLGAASRGSWCRAARCRCQVVTATLLPSPEGAGRTPSGLPQKQMMAWAACRQYGGLWLRLADKPYKPYKPYKPKASWCGERRCLVSAFGADSGVGSLSAVRGTLAATGGGSDMSDLSDKMALVRRETLTDSTRASWYGERRHQASLLAAPVTPSIKSIIVHFVHPPVVAAQALRAVPGSAGQCRNRAAAEMSLAKKANTDLIKRINNGTLIKHYTGNYGNNQITTQRRDRPQTLRK